MKPKVGLEIWDFCHVNCKFCYNDLLKEKKFKDISGIIDEIKKIAKISDRIILSWWETLLHPNIIEILKECRKYNIWINLITLWDRLSDLNFLKKILSIWSITSIQVSVNTLNLAEEKDLYWVEWIVKKQIKWLQNLKKYCNVPYYVSIVINKYNINSIWDIILNLNKNYWIKHFYISAIHIFKWISKNNIISTTAYIKLKKELEKVKTKCNKGEIEITLKSFPLCIHKFFVGIKHTIKELTIEDSIKCNSFWETDWQIKNKFKIKTTSCNSCYAYWKTCFWPYEYYVKLYWDKEFKSLNEKEYNDLIKN